MKLIMSVGASLYLIYMLLLDGSPASFCVGMLGICVFAVGWITAILRQEATDRLAFESKIAAALAEQQDTAEQERRG
jgi:xanthosine utilization system XapX-like protein